MRGHAQLLGLYVPGQSPLHRAPLGLKAACLLLPSLLALILNWLPFTVAVLAAFMLIAVLSRLPARTLSRPLALLAPILLLLGAYQCWLRGWEPATVVVANILAAILAARLLTLSTPGRLLLDGLTGLARPFRFLGADPERFGLTMMLMLRSIPYLLGSVHDVRDAARARGLERNPRAILVPVIVSAVGYARQTGEALTARGLGEPADPVDAESAASSNDAVRGASALTGDVRGASALTGDVPASTRTPGRSQVHRFPHRRKPAPPGVGAEAE